MSIEPQAKPEDHQVPLKAPPVHPQPEVEAAEAPENPKIQGPLTWGVRLWLTLTLTIAAAVLLNTAIYWHSPDLIKFGAFLSISPLATCPSRWSTHIFTPATTAISGSAWWIPRCPIADPLPG